MDRLEKGAEIFYSLLTYNSISQMASICENCEFISWHENQVTNNSFALGVTNGIKKIKMYVIYHHILDPLYLLRLKTISSN